jgi:xylulokinase
MLYVQDMGDGIYKETYKFLEPKDYLNLRLTGRFAASYDSIALHWVTNNRDISNIDYDPRLLRMSSIDRDKLPDLKRAIDIVGPIKHEAAQELGLNKNVQILAGTPDIQSAAIGSGAVGDYEGHLYIGTSSWLTCHVPFKKTDLLHNMASLPSAIPERYFVANEQQCAGACLTFLKDNLLQCSQADQPMSYATLDRIAERAAAGSHGLIFTPWLYGERTPVENHSLRGGFHNLSLQSTRAQLIRSVFEGVAYNSRWLLQYVEKFIKRRLHTITLVGGGANSNVWCQIHADVLNRTMQQAQDPILTNLRGAAFLASVALGYLTFNDIPERVQIAHTYHPNPELHRVYDDLFKEFINIYKNNRRIYARLNKVK